MLHSLQSKSQSNYISPYLIASIYGQLGEKGWSLQMAWEGIWCARYQLFDSRSDDWILSVPIRGSPIWFSGCIYRTIERQLDGADKIL